MQSSLPKQFMILGGEPVVARTINTFSEALPGAEIVVVLPQEHIALWKNLAARFDVAAHKCVAGGKERFDSVKCGEIKIPTTVDKNLWLWNKGWHCSTLGNFGI